MTRRHVVVYEWSDKNFSGFAPDIPGCAVTARTLHGMRKSLREALEFHLEGCEQDGDAPPEAVTHSFDLEDLSLDEPEYYCVIERLEVTLPSRVRDAVPT